MKNKRTIPVKRLVRKTARLLKGGMISPERAFATIRFAADGSGDPDAVAELARLFRNGIGCKQDKVLAFNLLLRSGKVDWMMDPAPEGLSPEENDSVPIDEDELYLEWQHEDRLVDAFLDVEDGDEEIIQNAPIGCNKDHAILIPGTKDTFAPYEEYALEDCFHAIPFRYVDYEVVEQHVEAKGNRYLDHVRVRVSTHPLLSEDEDGNLYLPERKFIGYEDYWFNIPSAVSPFNDTLRKMLG